MLKKTPKISVCLVIRNEEKNLVRCLESIKGVVDEIIIVHDGECLDNSFSIAKKYTEKIFVQEYKGMGELHYSFAFQKTSGDWILKIDADEFLSTELKNKLRNLADQNKYDAYSFLWLWFDPEKSRYFRKERRYKICFLRKEKMYFLGLPHSSFLTRGRMEKTDLVLGHVYCKGSFFHWLRNNYRWAKIHAEYLLKNPNQWPSFQAKKDDFKNFQPIYLEAPLLFFPLKAIKTIFERVFKERALNNPQIGIQKLFLDGFLYQLFLCWNLWRLKYFKK